MSLAECSPFVCEAGVPLLQFPCRTLFLYPVNNIFRVLHWCDGGKYETTARLLVNTYLTCLWAQLGHISGDIVPLMSWEENLNNKFVTHRWMDKSEHFYMCLFRPQANFPVTCGVWRKILVILSLCNYLMAHLSHSWVSYRVGQVQQWHCAHQAETGCKRNR